MRSVYCDEFGSETGTCHRKPTTFCAPGTAGICEAITKGFESTFLFSSRIEMMASTVASSKVHWM